MASTFFLTTLAILVLALAPCVRGEITTCENLDQDTCAFAVTSGKRCVLEKLVKRSGQVVYSCRTSSIEADKLSDWIETEQCIKACGLDRKTFGISSDSLLDSSFTQKLCSPQCYNNCPNIVDLHFNLAAGEGVFLPKLCEAQGSNVRRQMSELHSSGLVASGPLAPAAKHAVAPIGSAKPPISV